MTEPIGPVDPLPVAGAPDSRLPDVRTNGTGSLSSLFRQLADDGRTLVQQEITLAKAEVRSSIVGVVKGTGTIAFGIGLLLIAVFVFTAFLVLALGALLDGRYWLSSLIVAGVLALLGALALFLGGRGMRSQELKPERTMATLRENKDWARAEVQQIKRELTRSDEEL